LKSALQLWTDAQSTPAFFTQYLNYFNSFNGLSLTHSMVWVWLLYSFGQHIYFPSADHGRFAALFVTLKFLTFLRQSWPSFIFPKTYWLNITVTVCSS